jgi:hypothetical protein
LSQTGGTLAFQPQQLFRGVEVKRDCAPGELSWIGLLRE